jgi:hypothetical protein
VEIPIALVAGKNAIDLLSLTVGLQVSLPAFIKSGKLFIATMVFIFNEYIICWMIFFFFSKNKSVVIRNLNTNIYSFISELWSFF